MKTVVISGASGFVGRELAGALCPDFHIIGLSRSGKISKNCPTAQGRACDLFSYHDTLEALKGAHIGIYLVHSMLPRTRLTQASFQDMDFILADNFARASRSAGIEQIIYLGGLIPKGSSQSAHLKSRLEVEQILGAYGTPVTALRAGMVMGSAGSSYQIVQRLVERLPVMVCPGWTQIPAQPISIADVVRAFKAVINRPEHYNHSYDIGAEDQMSYQQIMECTARLMGKRRVFLKVPLLSPGLSRLWISLITGAPKNLVAPLVKSLTTPMLVDKKRRLVLKGGYNTIEQAIRASLTTNKIQPHAFLAIKDSKSRVRSIQRMAIPKNTNMIQLAQNYFRWLNGFAGVIRVEVASDHVYIRTVFSKKPLLTLKQDQLENSYTSYKITGGLLTYRNTKGLFDFRQSPLSNHALTGVHEFQPRLPWTIYSITQSKLHAYVMWRFSRHLLSSKV
jgi:nucleoside-diphosphate-sugar epimerase